MRRLVCVLLFAAALAAGADFALKDGDTVVFYGDSITDQRLYTTFTESYVVTRFPNMKVRFVHSGWGGDRVTGGGGGPIDARLRRDVIAYKPTVMTIMLGMNDGRYRAFDADLFKTFSTGYEQIVHTVKTAFPGVRITAIEPSPYDDVTRPPLFEGGYNAVLVRYGEFLRELAKRENLSLADLNTGVVAALRRAYQTDPAQAAKMLPDRVHPGPSGHLLMAAELLKAWGAPAVVSDVEIDGAAGAAKHTVNAAVTGVEKSANGIAWMQTDEALPMPVDWNDPLVQLAVKSSDFVDALDREVVRISGLAPGAYTLKIDGEAAGTYSEAQLAAGVSLAKLQTPMLKQALEVARLTVLHNNVHFARWRTVQVPLEKYPLTKTDPAMTALDALEEEIVAGQRAAARPKPHRFEVTI